MSNIKLYTHISINLDHFGIAVHIIIVIVTFITNTFIADTNLIIITVKIIDSTTDFNLVADFFSFF